MTTYRTLTSRGQLVKDLSYTTKTSRRRTIIYTPHCRVDFSVAQTYTSMVPISFFSVHVAYISCTVIYLFKNSRYFSGIEFYGLRITLISTIVTAAVFKQTIRSTITIYVLLCNVRVL